MIILFVITTVVVIGVAATGEPKTRQYKVTVRRRRHRRTVTWKRMR